PQQILGLGHVSRLNVATPVRNIARDTDPLISWSYYHRDKGLPTNWRLASKLSGILQTKRSNADAMVTSDLQPEPISHRQKQLWRDMPAIISSR
ncbi:MAG: hypothetical protein ACPIE8_05005, partial [Henriciella sp.]